MADAKSKADGLIHDNAVMIFSKTTCPHCAHSKDILTAKQKEYEAKGTPFSLDIYELDQASDGDDIQDYLKVKTRERTVPRIFVAQKTLGGRTKLDKGPPYPDTCQSRKLEKKTEETGILLGRNRKDGRENICLIHFMAIITDT
ncbi:hypothetical protein GJ744_006200 [Endocarpon pusillum]|uniref:Glutaredoxin domain-containing protein n=1 Tax=Endocarpon pusillum TaxID=364733 RepID=A0A8H7AK60_9EURO|nr:hypothetical protein GJ744_006200 [Endocarpon pusillum]